MNRRGFLSSCLALAAAPAIVRADSLMRIVPREATVLMPLFFGIDPAGNDVCVASAWVKMSGGGWQFLTRKIMPGENPHILVPRVAGVTALWAPQLEHGGLSMKLPPEVVAGLGKEPPQ